MLVIDVTEKSTSIYNLSKLLGNNDPLPSLKVKYFDWPIFDFYFSVQLYCSPDVKASSYAPPPMH